MPAIAFRAHERRPRAVYGPHLLQQKPWQLQQEQPLARPTGVVQQAACERQVLEVVQIEEHRSIADIPADLEQERHAGQAVGEYQIGPCTDGGAHGA